MADIRTKVAYLNGLAEGLGISKETKEGQVLLGILDIMNDMAEELEQLYEDQADLEDYVKAVDEDLVDLEDEVYEVDEDDGDLIELECPECGQTVFVKDDLNEDSGLVELMCPSCGYIVYSSQEEEPEEEIELPGGDEKFSLED